MNELAETITTVIERQNDTAESAETTKTDALVEDDLLVEEVSIDGMCGVY
jgi:mycofactocin precursor